MWGSITVTVKTFGLLLDRAWIWLYFPDFKHDYIKGVYWFDVCFAVRGPRTSDFHSDCHCIELMILKNWNEYHGLVCVCILSYPVCRISRNHGWSNGPPMVALWVVRSMLGGTLKIRVNLKLLHRWHMDFRMFFFCGLHTIYWVGNKIQASWKTLISFGDKKSWLPNGPPRWISRSPGLFIGHLRRPGDLLFSTLATQSQDIHSRFSLSRLFSKCDCIA